MRSERSAAPSVRRRCIVVVVSVIVVVVVFFGGAVVVFVVVVVVVWVLVLMRLYPALKGYSCGSRGVCEDRWWAS